MTEILLFELKKIILKQRGLIILLVTILLSLLLSITQYHPYFNTFEEYKPEYLQVVDTLKNKSSSQQKEVLDIWNNIIQESYQKQATLKDEYKMGTLDNIEYEKALIDSNESIKYEKLYKQVLQQLEYKQTLGDNAVLEYTQGMDGLLYNHFDYIFMVSVILLSTVVFLNDNSTHMDVIVNVTQNKTKSLVARYLGLVFVLICSLFVMEFLKYIILLITYGFSNLDISIQNSMIFQGTNFKGSYFIVYLFSIFTKIVWVVFTVTGVQLLCSKLKNNLYVFIITISVILLSQLFFDKGNIINFVPYVSLLNPYFLFRGQVEYNQTIYAGWSSIQTTMFIGVVLLITTLTVIKLYKSNKKKSKKYFKLFCVFVLLIVNGCATKEKYNDPKVYNSIEHLYFNESKCFYFSLLNTPSIIVKNGNKHYDLQRDPLQTNSQKNIDNFYIDENYCYYIESYDRTFSIKRLNLDDFTVDVLYTKEIYLGDYSVLFDSITLTSPNTTNVKKPSSLFVNDGEIFLEYDNHLEILESGSVRKIELKNDLSFTSYYQGNLFYIDKYNKLNRYFLKDKTDQQISKKLIEKLYIENEKIYYTDLKNGYLYSCDFDGNNTELLLNKEISHYSIKANNIFYTNMQNEFYMKNMNNEYELLLSKEKIVDFYVSDYTNEIILAISEGDVIKEKIISIDKDI